MLVYAKRAHMCNIRSDLWLSDTAGSALAKTIARAPAVSAIDTDESKYRIHYRSGVIELKPSDAIMYRSAQVQWEATVGEEVSSMLRRHREAAHVVMVLLQQEGRHMCDIRGQRMREMSSFSEGRIAAERLRVQHAIQEVCQEEQRAMQRLREEMQGFAEDERESDQLNIGRVARLSIEPPKLLTGASQNNQALAQQINAHGRHLQMMHQATFQQIHSFREQEIRMQYEI